MAFNMNRPIIKGTPLHKASVAKAKAKSIVSQARTQGDAGLIAAANALGKSYKPQAIDFELDKIDIAVPEIKEKKPLTPKEQAAKNAKKIARKAKRKETRGNIVDGVKTAIGGIVGIPLAIGNGLFKFGGDIIDELGNVVDGAKAEGIKGKEKRRIANEKRIADNLLKKEQREYNTAEAVRIRAEEKAKKEKEKAEKQAEKTEASRIKKENEAAAKAEADRIAEQKRLATLKAQEARFKENPLDITSEVNENERLLQSIEEKKGEDIKIKPKPKDIVRSNILTEEDIAIMNEKAKKASAYDPEDERVYTKEEQGRLVFDERNNEMRLPEEIAADKTNYNTNSVVEEKKTLSNLEIRKKKMAERKYNDPNTSQYIKDQMLKEGYVPGEGKSPMEMRDNRIYRNARADGPVRRNMIKGGYTPPN